MANKLLCDKGQTFMVTFRLKDEDGQPLDLTGYNARFQARTSTKVDGQVVLDLNTEDDTMEIIEEEGEITILRPWNETQGYTTGMFPWELELTSPDDIRLIVAKGNLSVTLGVIR